MKITRSRLTEIILSEVRASITESVNEKSTKKSKKPSKSAADQGPVRSDIPPDGGGIEPIASAPPVDGGLNAQMGDGEDADGDGMPDPGSVDPTDGEGADDAQAVDQEGKSGEEPSGAVNNETAGKTIQAITIEPESEQLPGAKEIVITFDETTEPLRMLVTPTGEVKFLWRGQLHDIP